ncbi:MAG: hypothetical protein QM723_10535 [Myxococcaceae bacterium]
MHRCSRCTGFVPVDASSCPNCQSSRKAWWLAPLELIGLGTAHVLLSACSGPICTTDVVLRDGGHSSESSFSCLKTFDCNHPVDAGTDNEAFANVCGPGPSTDGGP